MNFQTNSCYREKEKNLIVETLLGGHSILLVGKAGIGTSALLKFVCEELKKKARELLKLLRIRLNKFWFRSHFS